MYVSSRSVINGVANDGCYGRGLDFGRFMSYSSTPILLVVSVHLDANNWGNAKKTIIQRPANSVYLRIAATRNKNWNFFLISTTQWAMLQSHTQMTQWSCNNTSHCLTWIVNQVLLGIAKACLHLLDYNYMYVTKDAVVAYSELLIECYFAVFLLTRLGPYSL